MTIQRKMAVKLMNKEGKMSTLQTCYMVEKDEIVLVGLQGSTWHTQAKRR